MPVTSVRDIVVHGDDLDVATHGRGFWVMDQMSALRQIAEEGNEIVDANAYLFKPGDALAVPRSGEDGTPLPHEEPQELNPPHGVLAYYWLKTPAKQPLKLELLDSTGHVRACGASDTPVPPVNTEKIIVQAIWEEPAQLPPSTQPGMHRYALDLPQRRGFGGGRQTERPHDACSPPPGTEKPAAAPAQPGHRSAATLEPGKYTVRLTVDGKTYTRPVTVKPDPRGIPVDTTTPEEEDRD